MSAEPLDYEPRKTAPPDARLPFRILAGVLGLGATLSVPLFIFLKPRWLWIIAGLAEARFAYQFLRLAFTGRMKVTDDGPRS